MPVVEGCRAVDPRVVDENPILSEQNESSLTFLARAHKLLFQETVAIDLLHPFFHELLSKGS